MNSLRNKAIALAGLSAVPLVIIIFREFFYYRRGWHTLEIQYQTIFWIIRVLLSLAVIFYTIKFWREINDLPALVLVQAAGFTAYSILHWTLSFGLSRMLLDDPDKRNWNLFNTIRNESFILNLLMYVLAVSTFYVWTYYERNRAAEKQTAIFQESLTKSNQELARHQEVSRSLSEEKLQTLNIKTGHKTVMVDVAEVLNFLADGPYVKVITEDRVHLISQPLHQLQKILPPIFLRVHRSSIVNTRFIREIRSRLNGDYTLVLKNGTEVRASRTYRESLRAALGEL
jgi:hypothetical protein